MERHATFGDVVPTGVLNLYVIGRQVTASRHLHPEHEVVPSGQDARVSWIGGTFEQHLLCDLRDHQCAVVLVPPARTVAPLRLTLLLRYRGDVVVDIMMQYLLVGGLLQGQLGRNFSQ